MNRCLRLPILLAGRAAADTLMPLGDECNDAATLSHWNDIDQTEGWVLSTDESADIDTSSAGHFRIVPRAMGWFANLRGVLFDKDVTGDFVATMKVRVLSLQFDCRATPGVRLEVQQSAGLGAWSPVASRPGGNVGWSGVAAGFDLSLGPEPDAVRLLAPVGGERLFRRLVAVVE